MERMFGSQRAITIWVVSVVFAIVFPAYFSYMAAEADNNGGAPNAKGRWQVDFVMDNTTFDETMTMQDGETYDFFFDLERPEGMMIAYVEIIVNCLDNDEPGPGFSDDVDAATDNSGVEGGMDDSGSGTCSGDAITFRFDMTQGFDGSSYIADDVAKEDIIAQWNDGGNGSGEWLTSVTLNVNAPVPVLGSVVDDSEQVTVSWRAALYSLDINAVAEEL